MKKLIDTFIAIYGSRVTENEDSDYTDLMMDNHKCVKWGAHQWYIPENNSFYTPDEELIYEFLSTCRHV